jgi:hypothetical protein
MQVVPAKMREFALRYTAAWCSKDAASVAAFFSPGGLLTINNGTPAVGRSEIQKAAQSFMTAFPNLQVLMDDVVVQANCVEYRWTLIGTNTGPGGSGQRVHISGFEQWQIGADGLVASSLGHFDTSDYLHQLKGVVHRPR